MVTISCKQGTQACKPSSTVFELATVPSWLVASCLWKFLLKNTHRWWLKNTISNRQRWRKKVYLKVKMMAKIMVMQKQIKRIVKNKLVLVPRWIQLKFWRIRISTYCGFKLWEISAVVCSYCHRKKQSCPRFSHHFTHRWWSHSSQLRTLAVCRFRIRRAV